MQPYIVGIRFQRVGKIYHFDASSYSDLQIGDYAVVETSRGRQLGEVVQVVKDPAPSPEGPWKPIQRRATPRDLVMRQLWQKKELEAMQLYTQLATRSADPEQKRVFTELASMERGHKARLEDIYTNMAFPEVW